MTDVQTTLRDRLASVVTAMGYEFVGCELLRQGGSMVLRIYIDSLSGISLTDCSQVSRQVGAMLDVDDPIQGRYTLEISSPGIGRPLFEIKHYQKYIGNRVKVRLHVPMDGRRNFDGVLVRVDGENIHLLVDQEEVILSFSNIGKAKLIADVVG